MAAAVLAATAAGLSALLLGLIGIGTSPWALCAAALALWAGTRLLLRAPEVPLLGEAAAAWTAAGPRTRLAVGALAGVWVAWVAWLLRWPALDIDSVGYHLPQVVGWVGSGRPGSVQPLFDTGLPVGNYPLTNEVLLTWGVAIGRSFVWVSLWAPLLMALLALTGWGALRRLGAPPWAAGLGVAAVIGSPVVSHLQANGANTDLPALTWLVATGFLALASVRRPGLLAPAVLAAALAVGTKTTVLPLAALALLVAGWTSRAHLRSLALPLAMAVAAGVGIGGYWYLRNLVDHGSPLWPFVASPWGDPEPRGFTPVGGANASLLERPRETLDQVGGDWLALFAGGFVVIGGALVAAVATRTRAALAAGAATLGSALLWAKAPTTGSPAGYFELASSTVRYLAPTMAMAVATLGLAAGSRHRVARGLAGAVLGAGAALGLVQTAKLGFPKVPGLATVLLGALAGAAVALAADRLHLRPPRLTGLRGVVAVALVAALLGAALAVPASGWVDRHSSVSLTFGVEAVRWLAAQPDFRDGDAPIAGTPVLMGPMAGDRLQHEFTWLRFRESCSRVRAAARRGYVAVFRFPGLSGYASARCLRGVAPLHRDKSFTVYGTGRGTPR